MTIALTTPAQISMWVLLSRRSQVQMHLKGLTVKGLAACLKREFPEVNGRRVKDFVLAIEEAISFSGGQPDFGLVNVHVMMKRDGFHHDFGIYPSMAAVEAVPAFVDAYRRGRLELVLTLEDVRDPNGQAYIMQ